MREKGSTGIGKIKYGEFHIYHPLKFQTEVSFDKLCQELEKSSVFFSEQYKEDMMNALGYSLTQSIDEVNRQSSGESGAYLKMPDYDKYKSMKDSAWQVGKQNLRMEFDSQSGSIAVVNVEIEALENRERRIQKEHEHSRRIYGRNYINSQDRFLLLPLKITLNSGKTVWLHAVLYVFANKMGVLKLELSLRDVEIDELKSYDVDQYIKEISCSWNSYEFDENSLTEIKNFYLSRLVDDLEGSILHYGNDLRHIIMVDFENMPKSVNNIPNAVQEDLFLILSAPVQTRPCTSYKSDALEYMKRYSLGKHNVKILTKTTGGCLSLVDRDLLEHCIEEYKSHAGVEGIEDDAYLFICESLAGDLQISSEFALLIIMLKKMNQSDVYLQKVISPEELADIRMEYQKNVIFICELQEECYGTVSEQVAEFEKMMPYYMKAEITREKLAAIDSMLETEEEKKEKKFQDFIAVGGFLISLLFGLPAIYETISILKRVIFFFVQDIPFLTIDNVSFCLWMIINFVVFRFIKRKSKVGNKCL